MKNTVDNLLSLFISISCDTQEHVDQANALFIAIEKFMTFKDDEDRQKWIDLSMSWLDFDQLKKFILSHVEEDV